jgi:hypothetical protein
MMGKYFKLGKYVYTKYGWRLQDSGLIPILFTEENGVFELELSTAKFQAEIARKRTYAHMYPDLEDTDEVEVREADINLL